MPNNKKSKRRNIIYKMRGGFNINPILLVQNYFTMLKQYVLTMLYPGQTNTSNENKIKSAFNNKNIIMLLKTNDEQKQSLIFYRLSSDSINNLLWHLSNPEKYQYEVIDNVDSKIEKRIKNIRNIYTIINNGFKYDKDIIVFRNFFDEQFAEQLKKLTIGNIIEHNSFISTSALAPLYNEDENLNKMAIIVIPKNTPFLILSLGEHSEREILLNIGSLKKIENAGTYLGVFQYIPIINSNIQDFIDGKKYLDYNYYRNLNNRRITIGY